MFHFLTIKICLLAVSSLLAHAHAANLDRSGLTRPQSLQHARVVDFNDDEKETTPNCNTTSCYRYYNSFTAPYLIESWPDVPFETGEFYSGSVPIDESNPNRTLFFVFKPSTEPVDEVTIWLQGGPGCSSLYGFFRENGPIAWVPGTGDKKVKNPYAWSEMTNMLWVDNGVGVGFSEGQITARSELGIAKDFIGFFENWEKLFGIENYQIYLTA